MLETLPHAPLPRGRVPTQLIGGQATGYLARVILERVELTVELFQMRIPQ
jgi:hypothetical protein